jgi:hypothetical protein
VHISCLSAGEYYTDGVDSSERSVETLLLKYKEEILGVGVVKCFIIHNSQFIIKIGISSSWLERLQPYYREVNRLRYSPQKRWAGSLE